MGKYACDLRKYSATRSEAKSESGISALRKVFFPLSLRLPNSLQKAKIAKAKTALYILDI